MLFPRHVSRHDRPIFWPARARGIALCNAENKSTDDRRPSDPVSDELRVCFRRPGRCVVPWQVSDRMLGIADQLHGLSGNGGRNDECFPERHIAQRQRNTQRRHARHGHAGLGFPWLARNCRSASTPIPSPEMSSSSRPCRAPAWRLRAYRASKRCRCTNSGSCASSFQGDE